MQVGNKAYYRQHWINTLASYVYEICDVDFVYYMPNLEYPWPDPIEIGLASYVKAIVRNDVFMCVPAARLYRNYITIRLRDVPKYTPNGNYMRLSLSN
jgi:hypothetical protein